MSSENSTIFPTSALMPKDESGVNAFLEQHPTYDGRGVTIAIFDTGCDVASDGLIKCPDGRPKFVDFVDSTGSGDVDTSVVVAADAQNRIVGLSGRTIQLGEWTNPSGKWHIGLKRGYDIFPNPATSRLKAARKDAQQRRFLEMEANILAALAAAQLPSTKEADLQAQEEKQKAKDAERQKEAADDKDKDKDKGDNITSPSSAASPVPSPTAAATATPSAVAVRTKTELEAELAQLRELWKSWEDPGPLMDCIVWHDGKTWRGVVDCAEKGDVRGYKPLAAYRVEQEYRTFSQDSQINYTFNFYEDGNVLSIVVAAGSHGTHVAGIVAAYYPEDPKRNGQAPGAQLVSVKIGDTNLGTMETNPGMIRGLLATVENKCDMINMSYGEQTSDPNTGRFVELAQDIVKKHGIIYVSSAGNAGPCLSTVGSPGGNEEYLIGVGAFITPSMVQPQYSMISDLQADGRNYQWSSRGPSADGSMGVCISALGAACAPVPTWALQPTQLMNGTSMSSPAACGGIALLVSALKQMKAKYTPFRIKAAIEAAAKQIPGNDVDHFALGSGLLSIPNTFAWLEKYLDEKKLDLHYKVSITPAGRQEQMRGIYIRENGGTSRIQNYSLSVSAEFPKWQFEIDAENNAIKAGDVNLDGVLDDNGLVAVPDHPVLSNLRHFTVADKTHTEIRTAIKCDADWVTCAEWLLITSQTKTMPIVVDPTRLAPGSHLAKIVVVDADNDAQLFTVPVTVLVQEPAPYAADNNGNAYVYEYHNVPLTPAGSLAKYFAVPAGASWAHVNVKLVSDKNQGSKALTIAGLQLVPKVNPDHYDFGKVLSLVPGEAQQMIVPVYGGVMWELRVTRPWATLGYVVVDVDVSFHGVSANGSTRDPINMNADDHYVNLNLSTVSLAEVAPSASLTHCTHLLRPVKTWMSPLGVRDTLPDGRTVCRLTLEYTYDAPKSGEFTPTIVGVQELLYEAQIDGQMVHVYDKNNKFVGASDAFPRGIKLKQGESYTIRAELKHSDVSTLEKLKGSIMSLKYELDKAVTVNVYASREKAVQGKSGLGITKLWPGKVVAAVVQVPTHDTIPKSVVPGNILSGKFVPIPATFPLLAGMKKPPYIPLSYTVPISHSENAQHNSFPEPSLSEVKKSRDSAATKAIAADVDVEEVVIRAQIEAMKKVEPTKAASLFNKLGKKLLLSYRADIQPEGSDVTAADSKNGVVNKNDTKRMELAETVLQMVLRATPFHTDIVAECADIVLNLLDETEVMMHFGSGAGEGEDDVSKAKHKRMVAARTLLAQCHVARAISAVLNNADAAPKAILTAAQWTASVDALKDLRAVLLLARHVLLKEYGLALQKLGELSLKKANPLVTLLFQAAAQQAQEDASEPPRAAIHIDDTPGRVTACFEVVLLAALGWNELAQWKMRKLVADYPIGIERFF